MEIESWGDPAGSGRAQTDADTALDVLKRAGIPTRLAPSNKVQARLEAVKGFLTKMTGGQPGLLLSPRCHTLRKGFRGSYYYERLQVAGEARYRDMPCKNPYSHIHDALQYACLAVDKQRTKRHASAKPKRRAVGAAGY